MNPPVPRLRKSLILNDIPLMILRDYIDWTPFFQSWSLTGKYPAILIDEVVGAAALELFNEANSALASAIEQKYLQAKAVIGFWPANRVNDDIVLWHDESRQNVKETLFNLRQQHTNNSPNLCLSDFVAPAPHADFVGGFVVTVEETRTWDAKLKDDDYDNIMMKSLADRLVEASAEYLHKCVRKEYWGYAKNESFSNEELINEAYKGIRPAPGYPACPDHSEKGTLFSLLDASRLIGTEITENYAMSPPSTIGGWYFSHPQAKYFPVGRIGNDQLKDLATRKDSSTDEVGRWLSFSYQT